MRPPILCRERLTRILSLLDRVGGIISIRDFSRRFAVHSWELKQAEELGWINIAERNPRIGRPSRVVEKLSKNHSAKLPLHRSDIPREIQYRHKRFAMETLDIVPGGSLGIKISTRVRAYLKVFPNAKSRAGASASASRLMKRRDVRVARLWFQKTIGLQCYEQMPNTVEGIIQRLKERALI